LRNKNRGLHWVRIDWIHLSEFRNYCTLSYSPAPNLNLISGANAQGKSNLLEALGVLLTGRSFRTFSLGEIPRWGAESVLVSGELRRADGVCGVRRTLAKNSAGVWRAEGGSCPWARAIAFGWQDLAIVNGTPGARRDFVDGFAGRLYPTHAATLVRYRQVLARRNHLLQGGAAGATPDRLAPWSEQLVAVGLELIDRRRRAVAALQVELARVYPALAGSREKVEVRYRASIGEGGDRDSFATALERAWRDEVRRGQTLVGPHRDDLVIELDGVNARTFASRGRQRLLALALRLAEILPVRDAAGTPPVLLLDDALSELDPAVRANVLREIEGTEQVFLTAPEPVPAPGAARWEVREGGIAAA
jgi:DNA replication and repair protein RecF